MTVTARQTPRFSRAILLARAEASTLGHPAIRTEHLMLGLLTEEHGHDGEVGLLARHGVQAEGFRDGFELFRPRRRAVALVDPETTPNGSAPFSASAEAAVDGAIRIAGELADPAVGVRHLLLGTLDAPSSGAAAVLAGLGADVARIRNDALAGIADDAGPRPDDAAAPVIPLLTSLMDEVGRLSQQVRALSERLPVS